ncbi:MAG: hypothetical protein MI867_01565 [Pseudomonadales bacterium]|nr:hypothetical protein [Pseudomonadales bacterium]
MPDIMLRIILPGLIVSAMVAGIAAYIGSAERAKDERDGLRDNIETQERIDDAIDAHPACPWHDKLLGQCE